MQRESVEALKIQKQRIEELEHLNQYMQLQNKGLQQKLREMNESMAKESGTHLKELKLQQQDTNDHLDKLKKSNDQKFQILLQEKLEHE